MGFHDPVVRVGVYDLLLLHGSEDEYMIEKSTDEKCESHEFSVFMSCVPCHV